MDEQSSTHGQDRTDHAAEDGIIRVLVVLGDPFGELADVLFVNCWSQESLCWIMTRRGNRRTKMRLDSRNHREMGEVGKGEGIRS